MSGEDWVENRPATGLLRGLSFSEAWRRREVALLLALRQLKLRYKQTALGVAWAVIQPLAAVAILSLVFSRAGIGAGGDTPYAVFVLAGFAAWAYVSAAVTLAAGSLVSDRALVTRIFFPRILAPLSALLPPLADLAVAVVVLAVAMAIAGVAPGAALVALPAALALLAVIAAGAGLWLAALNVAYRDVAHALGFALQVWFIASPVFYATSVVPDGWKRALFHLNPLSGGIDLFRWAAGAGARPQAELAISVAVAVLLLVTGIVYFARTQPRLADVA